MSRDLNVRYLNGRHPNGVTQMSCSEEEYEEMQEGEGEEVKEEEQEEE